MTALRAALGISPDVYTDFAQLRRKVLEKAKSEIDQLAHFRVEWREIRQGRTVTEIEFRFEPKDAPSHLATVDEIERHAVGRKARRDGTVEVLRTDPIAIVATPNVEPAGEVTFPDGSIRYGPDILPKIAKSLGGGWDIDLIAEAYRAQMGDRLAKLRGAKLVSSWTGFCESFAARRGRP
jgi:hypothetical protein